MDELISRMLDEVDRGKRHSEDAPKIAGEFIVPPTKTTTVVPLDAFARVPPFATYIDRVFRRRKVKAAAQHARYMGALLDSKAEKDNVVFDRVQEILREMREPRRWLFAWHKIRNSIIFLIISLKKQWINFRKNAGF